MTWSLSVVIVAGLICFTCIIGMVIDKNRPNAKYCTDCQKRLRELQWDPQNGSLPDE